MRNNDFSDVKGVMLITGEAFSPMTQPIIEMMNVPVLDATGFRRELVYGGRSGDMLKFQYREISGDTTQPRVNQDFEWNLKDGMILTFRGARIEVLGATNAQLTYEVLSSFADQQRAR